MTRRTPRFSRWTPASLGAMFTGGASKPPPPLVVLEYDLRPEQLEVIDDLGLRRKTPQNTTKNIVNTTTIVYFKILILT
jgi:hypothetical protein